MVISHLDSALECEQNVESLVTGEGAQCDAVVEVPQLLCADGVGRVHGRGVAVESCPVLGSSHLHVCKQTAAQLAGCGMLCLPKYMYM